MIQGTWDLVEVDLLNVSGMTLWVSWHIWFPATLQQDITWIIGSLVGITLIALNIVKIVQAFRRTRSRDNDEHP